MTQEGYIRLYKNHKNKVGYWEGWIQDGTVFMQYASGLHDSPQVQTERIECGKQGRSIKEQALFRLASRAKGKIDAGYVTTLEDASKPPTDAEGKQKPMLAQKLRDYKRKLIPAETFVQPKLNGHRCFIMSTENGIFAYSRNGKLIPGIPHILGSVDVPIGTILDGEVYRHGWKLQTISSAAKKLQSMSKELTFVTYDIVQQDVFSKRFNMLSVLVTDGNLGPYTKLAPTKRLDEINDLDAVFHKVVDSGYEGLILRIDGKPYESGRRSDQLLKMKRNLDDEFVVIDILPSKDGWGILVCQMESGMTFKVSAPGTVYEKESVLKNKEKYIGKRVTVEFPEYTADGKVFQPVAMHWEDEK